MPGPADEEDTYSPDGSSSWIAILEDLCRRYAHAGLKGIQVYPACSVLSQWMAGVCGVEEADIKRGSRVPVEDPVLVWRTV